MTVLAVIGASALYMLYGWLLLAIVSSYLANRKGYSEKLGLASAMIFPPVLLVWLLMPAKPHSTWKKVGPFGRGTPGQTAKVGREPLGGPGPGGSPGSGADTSSS